MQLLTLLSQRAAASFWRTWAYANGPAGTGISALHSGSVARQWSGGMAACGVVGTWSGGAEAWVRPGRTTSDASLGTGLPRPTSRAEPRPKLLSPVSRSAGSEGPPVPGSVGWTTWPNSSTIWPAAAFWLGP